MRTRNEIKQEFPSGSAYSSQNLILEVLLDIRDLLQTTCTQCSHNFVDYQFKGAWGGTVQPPTKICTKCNMTV